MIRVLILDEQELFREGLKAVLSANPEIMITEAVPGIAEALRSATKYRPDVILIDIHMSGMDGVEAIRLLKERFPRIKLIVLTTLDDDESVFGTLKYGVSGYLMKNNSLSELVKAIQIACRGGVLLHPDIAAKAIRQFSQMAKTYARIRVDETLLPEIKNGEWKIIRAVGRGMSNGEIARELCLSEGTVRNSVSSILLKLSLRDRTQLAIWAVQNGIMNPGTEN